MLGNYHRPPLHSHTYIFTTCYNCCTSENKCWATITDSQPPNLNFPCTAKSLWVNPKWKHVYFVVGHSTIWHWYGMFVYCLCVGCVSIVVQKQSVAWKGTREREVGGALNLFTLMRCNWCDMPTPTSLVRIWMCAAVMYLRDDDNLTLPPPSQNKKRQEKEEQKRRTKKPCLSLKSLLL